MIIKYILIIKFLEKFILIFKIYLKNECVDFINLKLNVEL